jgi:hypothetical protein
VIVVGTAALHAMSHPSRQFFSPTETSNVRSCAKPDSTAGPVGQPLHPFHRRDALPRGTFNDGADGGESCACSRSKATPTRAVGKATRWQADRTAHLHRG